MQDHVAQGVDVELVVLLRQLDAPAADGAVELKGQVTLVAEAQLEQSRVVLAARRGDGFGGSVASNDSWVVGEDFVAVPRLAIIAAVSGGIDQVRLHPRHTA